MMGVLWSYCGACGGGRGFQHLKAVRGTMALALMPGWGRQLLDVGVALSLPVPFLSGPMEWCFAIPIQPVVVNVVPS